MYSYSIKHQVSHLSKVVALAAKVYPHTHLELLARPASERDRWALLRRLCNDIGIGHTNNGIA